MKKLLLLCALWASLPAMPQLKDVYGYLYCHMSRRGGMDGVRPEPRWRRVARPEPRE